jgi:hypothetical protein
MKSLSAIQILDVQDLVKAQLVVLYDKLSSSKYNDAKAIFMSEIKRLEEADKIMDSMWEEAMAKENSWAIEVL